MNFVRLAGWLKEYGKAINFMAIRDSPCFIESEKAGLDPEEILRPPRAPRQRRE